MIKYTELYVSTLARGLCNSGEQFVAAAAGSHQSLFTFGIPFFKHSYLLLATTERLLVIDHRKGLLFDRLDAVASTRWSDIGAMKLSGLFTKKLVVKDASGRVLLKMKMPPLLLNPIANNAQALRMFVQTWEQRRALGAPQQGYGALPMQGFASAPRAPVTQTWS